MRTINFLERKWAVGLWWQPLISSPRKQVRELDEQGAGPEESLYNVFATLRARRQIGVGKTDDPGNNTGIPSLAGALAKTCEQYDNILALFRFDDGNSWLFALKDGQILPGGDFYGDADEVLEQFNRYSQSDVWHQVIETAKTWETEDRIRQYIEDLLNPKSFTLHRKRLPKVWPVARSLAFQKVLALLRESPKTTFVAGAVVIVLLAIVIGLQQYTSWRQYQARRQMLAEKRAELQEKRLLEKDVTLEGVRKKMFPEKWRQEPDPLWVVHRCYDDLAAETYLEKGWKLAQIACGPKETRVVRKRTDWASFTLLPDEAKFQIRDPNKAVKTKRYAPEKRKARGLVSKEAVSANIYELAGIMGSPVELIWEKPKDKRVSENDRKKNRRLPEIIESPYWIGTFHFKQVPSWFVRNAFGFDRISGLVASEIKKNESWSIKGEVYAK